MLFVIQFDRRAGKTLRFMQFETAARAQATEARTALELEIGFDETADTEIVLLEAESVAAAQKTHRRYFEQILSKPVLDKLISAAAPAVPGSLR